MSDDPILETSPLSGPVSSGGKVVDVQIYRLEGNEAWTLEIEDEHGNSTVWDEEFDSESAAITEAKRAILGETVSSFIGPEDGKPTDDWR